MYKAAGLLPKLVKKQAMEVFISIARKNFFGFSGIRPFSGCISTTLPDPRFAAEKLRRRSFHPANSTIASYTDGEHPAGKNAAG